MGLFGALNVSSSGLSANQAALETSGNNIANVNTDGYSRQEVDMEEQPTVYMAGTGNMETGVNVKKVTRDVDDYVRSEVRDASSKEEYYSTESTELGDLEDTLNEPSDNGLTTQLSTLTTAWNTLASDPDLSTAKATVVEDAATFTDSLNQVAKDITSLQTNITSTLAEDVSSFNSDIDQLQTINKQIYTLVIQGQTPNDLLDERDSLLKDASTYAGITTSFDDYGRVSISIDGQSILTADSKNSLSVVTASTSSGSTIAKDGDTNEGLEQVSDDYDTNTLLLTSTDSSGNTSYSTLSISEGKIGGLVDASSEIGSRLQELNNFAETLGKAVNTVYTDGASSTAGFFDLGSDDNYAENISVNSTLDNNPDLLKSGTSTASGDSSIATAMVNLADAKLDYPITASELSSFDSSTLSFTSSSTGKTFSEAYSNIVTKNAISKNQADTLASSQSTVLTTLENQDQSVSGVSLTEEISDIIRYQHGYEANANVLNTISEMLDTLINKTGA